MGSQPTSMHGRGLTAVSSELMLPEHAVFKLNFKLKLYITTSSIRLNIKTVSHHKLSNPQLGSDTFSMRAST